MSYRKCRRIPPGSFAVCDVSFLQSRVPNHRSAEDREKSCQKDPLRLRQNFGPHVAFHSLSAKACAMDGCPKTKILFNLSHNLDR